MTMIIHRHYPSKNKFWVFVYRFVNRPDNLDKQFYVSLYRKVREILKWDIDAKCETIFSKKNTLNVSIEMKPVEKIETVYKKVLHLLNSWAMEDYGLVNLLDVGYWRRTSDGSDIKVKKMHEGFTTGIGSVGMGGVVSGGLGKGALKPAKPARKSRKKKWIRNTKDLIVFKNYD